MVSGFRLKIQLKPDWLSPERPSYYTCFGSLLVWCLLICGIFASFFVKMLIKKLIRPDISKTGSIPIFRLKNYGKTQQNGFDCLAPLSKGLTAFLARLRGLILSPKRILVIFRHIRKIAKREYQLRHVWLSVRPSIRMEYLGSHWREFREILYSSTVIPRLTKIIRSGITFVSRNVISRRFLQKIV